MKGMLLLTAVSLTVLLLVGANPALAMRDTQAGYSDGMSLYQYARSQPARYVDPSGLKIECECIDDYLHRAGIDDFNRSPKNGHYVYSGPASFSPMSVGTAGWDLIEVLHTMIDSEYTFAIKEFRQAELDKHIEARLAVLKRATAYAAGFGTTNVAPAGNRDWEDFPGSMERTRPGTSLYSAERRIGRGYQTGCLRGALDSMLQGISDVLTQDEFDKQARSNPAVIDPATGERFEAYLSTGQYNVGPASMNLIGYRRDDMWIPGDWGRLINNNRDLPADESLHGLHIIYLGRGDYRGHGLGIDTLAGLMGKIQKNWGQGNVPPTPDAWRRFPNVGLQK